jgi:hypothetical protein
MCLKRHEPLVTHTQETVQSAARHEHAIAHTFLLNQSHCTGFTHVIQATNHKQLATSRHYTHENSENPPANKTVMTQQAKSRGYLAKQGLLLLCWTHKSRLSEGTKAIAFQ